MTHNPRLKIHGSQCAARNMRLRMHGSTTQEAHNARLTFARLTMRGSHLHGSQCMAHICTAHNAVRTPDVVGDLHVTLNIGALRLCWLLFLSLFSVPRCHQPTLHVDDGRFHAPFERTLEELEQTVLKLRHAATYATVFTIYTYTPHDPYLEQVGRLHFRHKSESSAIF